MSGLFAYKSVGPTWLLSSLKLKVLRPLTVFKGGGFGLIPDVGKMNEPLAWSR